ncbi:MAG TPA: ABC transporter permease [Thermomicrobiales bacterium]|nr:ABC transporter permease [Thermomicrobiales bacterium]
MSGSSRLSSPAPGMRRIAAPAWLTDAGQTYGALTALVALFLFNALFTDQFLTMQSLRVNVSQVATIIIVGTGMTLVIATGGIDLSVGSLMAISGAIAPLIFLSERAPFDIAWVGTGSALILPIIIAGLFGLFNGILVAFFRIQPIIATLVLFIAGRGIAQVLTNGSIQTFRNPEFQYIGLGRPFGIPFQAFIAVAVVIVTAWVVRSTTFGRYLLATGGNEPAARLAGVPVARIKLTVYVVSGLLAGLAGLIVISINSSSDANLVGLDMELNAIAAVAVGGTPLTGGRATVVGTMIGALILQLIRTTLLSHNIADAVAQVVTASAIVLAVLIQRGRGR